ncbi:hypothetical protein AAC387_Pa09g1082 [Persea americana]
MESDGGKWARVCRRPALLKKIVVAEIERGVRESSVVVELKQWSFPVATAKGGHSNKVRSGHLLSHQQQRKGFDVEGNGLEIKRGDAVEFNGESQFKYLSL